MQTQYVGEPNGSKSHDNKESQYASFPETPASLLRQLIPIDPPNQFYGNTDILPNK